MTCWSTPTTRAAPRCPTCAPGTATPTRTASGCGAWATSWTAPGRSGTRRPTSTAASPSRPPRRCARSTRASSSSPAAAPTARCRRSARGRRPCSTTPTTPSTTSACTPTTRSATATSRASSPPRSTWTTSSARSSRPPTTSGAKRRSRKRINLSFDEWNVWYQHEFAGHTNLELEQTPRAHRGHLLRRGCRGRRRLPQLLPAPRRPGQDRLPGPARQRHRPRSAPRRAAPPGGRRSSTRSRRPPGSPGAPSLRVEPRGATHETALHGDVDTRRRQRHLGRGDRRRRRVPRQPPPHRARRRHHRRPGLRGPAGHRVPPPRRRRPAPHQHRGSTARRAAPARPRRPRRRGVPRAAADPGVLDRRRAHLRHPDAGRTRPAPRTDSPRHRAPTPEGAHAMSDTSTPPGPLPPPLPRIVRRRRRRLRPRRLLRLEHPARGRRPVQRRLRRGRHLHRPQGRPRLLERLHRW